MACRKLHWQLNWLGNKGRERKRPWTLHLVLFPPASCWHSRCFHLLLAKIISKLLKWVKLLGSSEQHTCLPAPLLENGMWCCGEEGLWNSLSQGHRIWTVPNVIFSPKKSTHLVSNRLVAQIKSYPYFLSRKCKVATAISSHLQQWCALVDVSFAVPKHSLAFVLYEAGNPLKQLTDADSQCWYCRNKSFPS